MAPSAYVPEYREPMETRSGKGKEERFETRESRAKKGQERTDVLVSIDVDDDGLVHHRLDLETVRSDGFRAVRGEPVSDGTWLDGHMGDHLGPTVGGAVAMGSSCERGRAKKKRFR
jgi:hypothetical protein